MVTKSNLTDDKKQKTDNSEEYATLKGPTPYIGQTSHSESTDIGNVRLFGKEEVGVFPEFQIPSFLCTEMNGRLEFGIAFSIETVQTTLFPLFPTSELSSNPEAELLGDTDFFSEYILRFLRIAFEKDGNLVPDSPGFVWIAKQNVQYPTQEQLMRLVEVFPEHRYLYELMSELKGVAILKLFRKLFQLLQDIPGFQPLQFLATTLDISRSLSSLPPAYLREFIRKILGHEHQDSLGIVTKSSIGKANGVLFDLAFNIKKNPTLQIDDPFGRISYLAVATNVDNGILSSEILCQLEMSQLKLASQAIPLGSLIRTTSVGLLESYEKIYTGTAKSVHLPLGTFLGTNTKFSIVMTPGRNMNSGICALAGAGKTNLVKVLILQAIRSNSFHDSITDFPPSLVGGLLIDRHSEYCHAFNEIAQANPALGKYIITLNPTTDLEARIPLKWIPLETFFEKTTSELAIDATKKLLHYFYNNNPDTAPRYGRVVMKDKLSVDSLNWLLNLTVEEMASYVEGYQSKTLQIIPRELDKIKYWSDVLQIAFIDGKFVDQSVIAENDLIRVLYHAQEEGKFIFLDLETLDPEHRRFMERYALKRIRSIREKVHRDNQGSLDGYPLFLVIVEEAIESLAGAEEETIQTYRDMATGARKFFMGYLLVLQTVHRFDRTLLSQLAYTFILRIPQSKDRAAALNNFPGNLSPYERLIATADDGMGVAAILDKLSNTPVPMQITLFGDLVEEIINRSD